MNRYKNWLRSAGSAAPDSVVRGEADAISCDPASGGCRGRWPEV